MTATNHVMTGAVIAVAIKQPALVIPLAFASHFALDAMPHFGIYENDVVRRNKHWLFQTVLGIDITFTLVLFGLLPHLAAHTVAGWIVFASMAVAILPDSVWVFRFIREVRTKRWEPGGWYARLHQAIQWFEHPVGLILEAIWFGVMLITFHGLVA